jgi:hypothetical protein
MSDATEPCDECDCVDGHSLRCTKREPEPPTADRLRNLVHDVTDPETADALHALVDLVFALCARLDMLEARPAPAPAPRVPAAGARRWRKLPHKHEGHDQWTLRDDDNDKAPGVVYAYLSAPGALYWFAYGVGGAGRVKLAEALHDAARLLGLDPATVELPPEAEPAPLCALPFRGGTCHLPQGHRGAHSIARGPVVAGDLAAPAEAAAGAVHDVRVGHVGCVLALVGGTARLADGSDIVARLSLSGSAGLVHVRAPAPADRAEPPPTPEELLRREGFVRGARNVWWRGARNDYPALIVNDANIIVCRTLEDDTHGGKPFPSSDLPAAIAYALGQDAPAAEPPRCTCGSGAHPRRCELHPDAYDRHIAELNRANDEDNAQDEPAPWRYERCKAPRCNGRRNCVGFRVDDAVWSSVVPSELRGRVVCLECFDEMAQEARVAYEVRELFPVTWCADESAQPEPAPEAAAGAVREPFNAAEAVAFMEQIGLKHSYMERVLDLERGTFKRLAAGEGTAEEIALLRMIHAFPRLLDVAQEGFRKGAAEAFLLRQYADIVEDAPEDKPAPAQDRAEPPPGYGVRFQHGHWYWAAPAHPEGEGTVALHVAESEQDAVRLCWAHALGAKAGQRLKERFGREHAPAQPEPAAEAGERGNVSDGRALAMWFVGLVNENLHESDRQPWEDFGEDEREALATAAVALYSRGRADARRAGGDELAKLHALCDELRQSRDNAHDNAVLLRVKLEREQTAYETTRSALTEARAELAKLQADTADMRAKWDATMRGNLESAAEVAKLREGVAKALGLVPGASYDHELIAAVSAARADLDARTRERDELARRLQSLREAVVSIIDARGDLERARRKPLMAVDYQEKRERACDEALGNAIRAAATLAEPAQGGAATTKEPTT